MQPQLKHLGLTQLEKVLPTLFETARLEQWTYELFLTRAIAAEIEGRDRRAAQRRMTAARLPTLKTLEAFDFAFQPTLSERLLCPRVAQRGCQKAKIVHSPSKWKALSRKKEPLEIEKLDRI